MPIFLNISRWNSFRGRFWRTTSQITFFFCNHFIFSPSITWNWFHVPRMITDIIDYNQRRMFQTINFVLKSFFIKFCIYIVIIPAFLLLNTRSAFFINPSSLNNYVSNSISFFLLAVAIVPSYQLFLALPLLYTHVSSINTGLKLPSSTSLLYSVSEFVGLLCLQIVFCGRFNASAAIWLYLFPRASEIDLCLLK